MFRAFPAPLAVPVVALGLLIACGERDTTSLEPAEPAAAITATVIASNTWQDLADLPTERRNAMLAAVTKANGDTRLFAIAGGTPPPGSTAAAIPCPRSCRWGRSASGCRPPMLGSPGEHAVHLGSRGALP
jgi:hypothetical protein